MILTIPALIFVFCAIAFVSISFYIGTFYEGPFVPSSTKATLKVLKAAEIKKGDKLYDLGAGDGRYLHYASKEFGAQAVGFEINPFIYFWALFKQKFFGWQGKMYLQNFNKANISDADIVICYLLPGSLKKMQKDLIKKLKKGTKIVSYCFSFGDLQPKKIIPADDGVKKILIYEV